MREVLNRWSGLAVGNTPFAGRLRVATCGYRWGARTPREAQRLGSAQEADVLLPVEGPVQAVPVKHIFYAPLAVTDLHRRFARLSLTRDAIRCFADKYGPLGHAGNPWAGFGREGTGSPQDPFGDTYGEWCSSIVAVAGLIDLVDSIRRRESGKIARVIRPVPGGRADGFFTAAMVLTHRGINWETSARGADMLAESFARHHPYDDPSVVSDEWPRISSALAAAEPTRPATVILALRTISGMWMGRAKRFSASHVRGASRSRSLARLRLAHLEPFDLRLRQEDHREAQVEDTAAGRLAMASDLAEELLTGTMMEHVVTRVAREAPGGFAVVPDCLSGAIYSLLALDMAGRTRRVESCAYPPCGRSFVPADSRQRYCEAACRRNAYYHRHPDRATPNGQGGSQSGSQAQQM